MKISVLLGFAVSVRKVCSVPFAGSVMSHSRLLTPCAVAAEIAGSESIPQGRHEVRTNGKANGHLAMYITATSPSSWIQSYNDSGLVPAIATT